MYALFRPILFKLDPESAHQLTLQSVRLAGVLPPARWFLQALFAAPEKPVEVFGLKFKNAVGLAAGFDKDGVALHGLATLGFGHLEIGTITPRPQPGNPRPRVFRLVEDQAVIQPHGISRPGSGVCGSTIAKDPERATVARRFWKMQPPNHWRESWQEQRYSARRSCE